MALLFRSSRQLSNLAYRSAARSTPSLASSILPRRFSSTAPGSQAESQEAPSGAPGREAPQPATPNSPASNDAQTGADQLAQKDAQIAEYKDLYIRARAEFENLQKITSREKMQAKDYAIQSFAKDLVSNIDVLQLALNSVPESLRTLPTGEDGSTGASEAENRKHLADLWAGVQSTKSLLEQTLSRYGVSPFDPTGEQFDPNKHEAMYQALVPGKEPNSVLNCSKVGWMLRDRVLRPAQVGVAQGSDSYS